MVAARDVEPETHDRRILTCKHYFIETLQAKVAFCSDTLPFFSNALDTIEVIACFNRQPARYRAVLRPQQRAHAVRSEPDILANLVLVACHL